MIPLSEERRYTALWYINATAEQLQLARQYKRAGDRTKASITAHLARTYNRMVRVAIYTGRV